MTATENIAASAQPQSAHIEIDWQKAGALIEAAHAARDHMVGTTNWAAAVYRHMAERARKAEPLGPHWWRKRADEIEAQVALTGSPEAMRCYTDMRTLLQAAAGAAPQQEAQEAQEPCPSCRNSDIYACTCPFPTSRNAAPQPAPAPPAKQIAECYGDCPTDPSTCANPCKFEGRKAPAPLSDDVSQKTWALLDELEKLRSASLDEEDWGALNRRDSELRAALVAQEDA